MRGGNSLRFAILPEGEDPDSFLRRHGSDALTGLLSKAHTLSQMIWRLETQGRRFDTPEARAGWDLSCLKVVMSAAEPVRPETVDAFLRAFKPSKLDPRAFCPAYGLAEHTVGVSVRGRASARLDPASHRYRIGIVQSPTPATDRVPVGAAVRHALLEPARLTIEQLDMTEQNVDTIALMCTGNGIDKVAGLWFWRSILRGSTTPVFPGAQKPAISLNDCSTRIEQNIIGVSQMSEAVTPSMAPAHGGGISISDKGQNTKTGYNIENNLIAGNISTAVDLLSSLSPKVLIRFNTIAYNGRQPSARVGGIQCRPLLMSKSVVNNNIFFGNLTVAASQISYADGCAFVDTVVGSADSCAEQGLRKNNPEFDANFALSDSAANRTCCIDQVTQPVGEIYPLLDLKYLTRPSGKSYDIGAFELQQIK